MTYVPGKVLREVRAKISKAGMSEGDAVQNVEMLRNNFDRLQELREEMNEAKKAAAAEAAKPYIELMERIEKEYAMYLKLSAS